MNWGTGLHKFTFWFVGVPRVSKFVLESGVPDWCEMVAFEELLPTEK